MYKLLYTDDARKQIQKCDKKWKVYLQEALEKIAIDPSVGKALTRELRGRWSYRVGDYRIIYRIYQQEIIVLILAVGHRKDVYKRQSRKI